VAQLRDEHLTTEQLSAFFDKQLSPEEQAIFGAHMSTCQQCPRNLADLRLTVSLLRAMPEEAVPRSFVLPGSLAPVPQKQRVRFNTMRRSVRVVSALAAVLALMFIISGILPPLHFGASESSSTAAPVSSSSGAATNTSHTAISTPNVQETAVSHPQEGVATTTRTPATTPSAAPTGTATKNASTGTPADQGSSTPPAIDLSQPVVRLSLGIIVLALSIIGLIVTRRRRVAVN
jgi:putative zinc finger protein